MTLAHATLTTGHVVHHPPVQWQSAAARTCCYELLAAALEGTGPLWEGWALHARLLDGPVMECHAVCDCHHAAAATWWTAAPGTATAATWRLLRDGAPARDLLPDAMEPPWCAVTVLPAAAGLLPCATAAMAWLGDAERCLSWAWVDGLGGCGPAR